MCGSNDGFGSACCPSGQVFQEKLCGNIDPNTEARQTVWQTGPGANDYFQGTFEVFNSSTTNNITFAVLSSNTGGTEEPITVLPQSSVAISVVNPNQFIISTGGNGASGSKWCATLYKRIY